SSAGGKRRAKLLGGVFELLQRGRLADELQVDDALAEGVELVAPDERVQRHAGLPRARADLADELALERLLVELALAGDHGAARAHAGVEVERVEHERRARLEGCAVRGPEPAGERPGGRGHRDATRVLGKRSRELV